MLRKPAVILVMEDGKQLTSDNRYLRAVGEVGRDANCFKTD